MKAKNIILPGIIFVIILLFLLSGFICSPQIAWLSDLSHVRDLFIIQSQIISLSDNYPASIQQWRSLIEKNAYDSKINPNLIAAVIMQESGGNANAYSSSGAVGLMQVMPCNGLATNYFCGSQPCFKDRPTIHALQEPAFKIEFGTRMLLDLHNKYSDWRNALNAYGPMDVGFDYADLILQIFNDHQTM